jgi:hypothetical protein
MNLSIELALNLLWAGVSLTLIFGLKQRRSRGCTGEFLRAVAALSLAFVLFPIISITDDLNSAPAMVETAQATELAPQNQHSSGPAGALLPFRATHTVPVENSRQQVVSISTEAAPRTLLTFIQKRRPPPANSI